MRSEQPFGGNAEAKGSAQEQKEAIPESVIIELMNRCKDITNAGNNGIILKFPKEDIPEDVRGLFGGNEKEAISVKALKIYRLGDAEREYDMLRSATDIIEASDRRKELARTSRPIARYELTVNDEIGNFLDRNGAHIPDRKVGVVVMDFIEGEDLATLLYKEVIRGKLGKNEETEAHLTHLSFDELHSEAGAAAGFAMPGRKGASEGERFFEEEMVKSGNVKKLITALKRSGFRLSPSILEKIKNTVAVLHENGIFHNDLHERNVLIGNGDPSNPDVHMIDFGSASRGKMNPESKNFKVSDDEDLIRRLTPLTVTLEEEKNKTQREQAKYWDEIRRLIERQPRWRQESSLLRDALKKSDMDTLEAKYKSFSAADSDLEKFLVTLLALSRENGELKNNVLLFLGAQRKKGGRAYAQNKIREIEERVGQE